MLCLGSDMSAISRKPSESNVQFPRAIPDDIIQPPQPYLTILDCARSVFSALEKLS